MQKQKKPLVLKPNTSLTELTTVELDKVTGGTGGIPRLGNSGGGSTSMTPTRTISD